MCICWHASKSYKEANGLIAQATVDTSAQPVDNTSSSGSAIKSEPVDPLQMDIEEDDLDYESDKLNVQV